MGSARETVESFELNAHGITLTREGDTWRVFECERETMVVEYGPFDEPEARSKYRELEGLLRRGLL